MALLITPPILGTSKEWRDAVVALMPDLEVRLWPEVGDPADIEYLLIGRFDLAELPPLPNLRLILAMFAGFEHLLYHPDCPPVPFVRTGPPAGDPAMTEYTVLHVLRHHRHMPDYLAQQRRKEWQAISQKQPHEQRIGFLGLGNMAAPPARALASLGFDVAAWVRTPRSSDDDVTIFANAETFAALPRGAAVINLGRGDHIVDEDLIAALDSGHLSGATLDATSPEPLPPESGLWSHPAITIMPHVARRVRGETSAPQIVENIRRDRAGAPLLWQVDREAGY
jgi:glyoxylate/hydroxypyruvate reductase A